jgi:hypothetical protein
MPRGSLPYPVLLPIASKSVSSTQIASYDEQAQESRMTERVTSGLTWRGLETDLRWS